MAGETKVLRERLPQCRNILHYALQALLLNLGLLSNFPDPTLSRTPWTGDQLVARSLPTHKTTQTQENIYPSGGIRTHDFSVGEAKTVHASDTAATVIGPMLLRRP
jgi:hypothetical protein